MKIAIFGDSFGDDRVNWQDQNKWLDVGPSWVDYLRQFHDIDNYSAGGSSLYFTKLRFDNADLSKYDKVIFIATSPFRRFNYDSNWNIGRVESELKKKDLSLEQRVQLAALRMYFIYVWNDSDLYFHNLMISDIENKCPGILRLRYSLLDEASNNECKQLCGRLLTALFKDGLGDARKCHLCEENNLILGKQIQHCLENNLDLNIDIEKFVTPPREFDYYFRKV
jgi:hypothetical protein